MITHEPLHLASLKTAKEDPTIRYLHGRMLLTLLNYALCPQIRAALWEKQQREASVLKLVWHFYAFAERWMQAIFQSVLESRRFLQQVRATAERLVGKASCKRHPTAQILRESLQNRGETVLFMEGVYAELNADAMVPAPSVVGRGYHFTYGTPFLKFQYKEPKFWLTS